MQPRSRYSGEKTHVLRTLRLGSRGRNQNRKLFRILEARDPEIVLKLKLRSGVIPQRLEIDNQRFLDCKCGVVRTEF
jgi:hypothetical protein